MNTFCMLLLAVPIFGPAQDAKRDAKPEDSAKARLLELHKREAAEYTIYLDAAHKERLELQTEPVLRWRNLGDFTGDVFIWTHRGRPEVVATIFSRPENGRRAVYHEFHSLSLGVLDPVRPGRNQWSPQAAGIELKPVPDAPVPSAAAWFSQAKTLAHDFSAHSVSLAGERWDLRLLTQPICRYENPVRGAAFAFASTEGTDPEVILVIEARPTQSGPQWQYALARFSDKNLWVKHKTAEVWSCILDKENTLEHDAKHRYRLYRDKMVDEIKEAAP